MQRYKAKSLSDVTRFCISCDVCQRTVPKGKASKVPLGKMPIIDEPFKHVSVDLIGHVAPVSQHGNKKKFLQSSTFELDTLRLLRCQRLRLKE